MKRNTKEEILLEALKLFARDGYEGVTVRDIAARLGIRQSSLYKHYESKQAIFESIVAHMNAIFGEKMREISLPDGAMDRVAEDYGRAAIGTVEKLAVELFRYWTEDEYACAFRRMLILEQYRNNELRALYQNYLAAGVIEYQAAIFSEMIRQGYFVPEDPKQLAMQFYGPISVMMAIYDGTEDETVRAGLIDGVKAHVTHFGQHYAAGEKTK